VGRKDDGGLHTIGNHSVLVFPGCEGGASAPRALRTIHDSSDPVDSVKREYRGVTFTDG
jgi:hypothetical protein